MAQITIPGITSGNYTDEVRTLELPFGAVGSINFWETDSTGATAVPQTTNQGPDSRDANSWVDSPDGPQTTKQTMILTGVDYALRLRPVTGTWTMSVTYAIDRDLLLGPTA